LLGDIPGFIEREISAFDTLIRRSCAIFPAAPDEETSSEEVVEHILDVRKDILIESVQVEVEEISVWSSSSTITDVGCLADTDWSVLLDDAEGGRLNEELDSLRTVELLVIAAATDDAAVAATEDAALAAAAATATAEDVLNLEAAVGAFTSSFLQNRTVTK